MVKPEKATQLIDYLEERLVSGQYSVGTRIPSVRRFSDKFNVSYGTALRGIDFLCSKGKLEKVPHRGIYVKERRPKANHNTIKRIAVFMEPYVTERHCGMCYTAFLGMQEQALKTGYTFLVNPLLMKDVSNERIKEMSQDAEGIILLNEYDMELDDLNLKVPTVGVLVDNSFGGKISTVNLDPYSSAKIAVEFFAEKGFKDIIIVSSPKPVFITRGRIFELLWRAKGYNCEWSFSQYDEVEFKKNRGYFFTSDQRAQDHADTYYKNTGRQLEKDYPILGLDGKQLIDPSFYRFPSVAINWKTIGEIAFNECISRINNPGRTPINITLDGKLIVPKNIT
jgi:DNA-binding LacI/PurR family transcriptional regulator